MEIFAASTENAAESFLHVGYVSAYPRDAKSLDFQIWFCEDEDGKLIPQDENIETIDVAQALTLTDSTENETLSATIPMPNDWSADTGFLAKEYILTIIGTSCLFAVVALVYLSRYAKRCKTKLASNALTLFCGLSITATAGLAASFGIFYYYDFDHHSETLPTNLQANELPPPWEKLAVKSYADPEAATRVILYGIIGEAISNSRFLVTDLTAIQGEVGLPTKSLSTGMTYALCTYGRDGWGRDFQLETVDRYGHYRVSSAGPDGQHGTEDDIELKIPRRTWYDWEHRVSGVYMTKIDDLESIFVHRCTHRNFLFRDQEKAIEETGGPLYDIIELDDRCRSYDHGLFAFCRHHLSSDKENRLKFVRLTGYEH